MDETLEEQTKTAEQEWAEGWKIGPQHTRVGRVAKMANFRHVRFPAWLWEGVELGPVALEQALGGAARTGSHPGLSL